MRICPVSRCKFHTHPVPADSYQIKRHLKFDHDYREKQETAFSLGLIDFIDEKRSSTWFVDALSYFSKIGGIF